VILEAVYGLGRLAFGAGMIGAPERLGSVLIGGEARKPMVRTSLRLYGTRDVVLGLGTLRAAAAGEGAGGWLMAGIASDVLDTAVQLLEWDDLPSDKRVPGVLAAVGAAAAGIAVLARHPNKPSFP
jgi:hypothetical protein